MTTQTKNSWQSHLKDKEITKAIVAYVKENEGTTFPALTQDFSKYIEVKGGWSLHSPTINNVLFWDGLSKELMEAFRETINISIFLHGGSLLTMLVDGGALSLPMVGKNPPVNGYKTPRWVPTVIKTVPIP